jgi:hypothetical protein
MLISHAMLTCSQYRLFDPHHVKVNMCRMFHLHHRPPPSSLCLESIQCVSWDLWRSHGQARLHLKQHYGMGRKHLYQVQYGGKTWFVYFVIRFILPLPLSLIIIIFPSYRIFFILFYSILFYSIFFSLCIARF